jgi:anti-sigma B factor antagonist
MIDSSRPTASFAPFEYVIGSGRTAIVRENGAGYDVVYVFGEVDLITSPELEHALAASGEGDNLVVVVDFSECRYLDSTTFTVLVRAKKALGDRLRVVVPDQLPIRRLFDITNLTTVLRVEPTLAGAIG